MTGIDEAASSGRPLKRSAPPPWPSFLQALLANPLTRNGYALVASFVITSALGVVFWIVAARLYPQDQVGIGSVMVTTMITLSSASQLGFGNWLNRELPVAKGNSARLILTAYTAATCASLILAFAFNAIAPAIAPDLAQALSKNWIALWFMLAVAAWTLFALQDSVLAGLRLSVWVPVENAVYALTKLALLPALALVSLSGYSLFAAWTAPILVLILAVNLLVLRRAARLSEGDPPSPVNLSRMVSLIGWDYAAGLALTAALGIAPILVLNASGPTGSASYGLSWTITYALYLVGRSMGISLLAEGVASPDRLRALMADTLVYTMVPLVGAAIAIFIGAPLLMGLFGEAYAKDGSAVLQILALASIPWGFLTIRLAMARALRQMRLIFLIQVSTLVLVVGLGLVLVRTNGPQGMALSWLLAHSTVLCALVVGHLRTNGFEGALAFALDIASAIARVIGKAGRGVAKPEASGSAPKALTQILSASGDPAVAVWRPLGTVASFSDSAILLVGDHASMPPRPVAVFKQSSSPEGMAALRRCLAGTAALRNDLQHTVLNVELPKIIGSVEQPDTVATLEALIPGHDGRKALSGKHSATLLMQSAAAIRHIHASTCASVLLDESWIAEWIDRPVDTLAQVGQTLISERSKAIALGHLRAWQRKFWLGRSENIGRGHGDFSPGNLMFLEDDDGPRLSGILDWEQTRADFPAEMDTCMLALTMRMEQQNGQIGGIVRDILTTPTLTAAERVWLVPRDGSSPWKDPEWVRAMSGLVWLHHVAANLNKSPHYARNRLWLAQNVDWVLRNFLRGV